MENEVIYVTQEGYDRMQKELEYLDTIKKQEIADRIEVARGFGDLSENSEYTEAKDAQRDNDNAIDALKLKIKNAKIVEQNEASDTIIGIGTSVTVEELEDGEVVDTYDLTICAKGDEDVEENRISYTCPIGKGLMNHTAGDIVSIAAPGGEFELRIVSLFVKKR